MKAIFLGGNMSIINVENVSFSYDKRINVIKDLSFYIEVSTGNVKGTIKSPMDYEASSNTGKVIVPLDQGSNKCIINTDTGDIIIKTN